MLTVGPGQSVIGSARQSVIVASDILLPSAGLSANDSSILMTVGSFGGTGIPVLESPAVPAAFSALRINTLLQSSQPVLPKSSSVRLSLVDPYSVLTQGDRVSLRPSSSTCYSTRYQTDPNSQSEAETLDQSLTAFINSNRLSAGLYRVCYVRGEVFSQGT